MHWLLWDPLVIQICLDAFWIEFFQVGAEILSNCTRSLLVLLLALSATFAVPGGYSVPIQ